ncbi:MAG TPA: hypothetical protein VGF28_25730 [Thermoanaerobaculia bacterium]|jgi:hypothetical protein
MRVRIAPFSLILLLLSADAASGQCVAYYVYGPSSATTIGVHKGTGWSQDPPLGSAISMWNDGCSNQNDFPLLLNGGNGDIDITVSRVTGMNPTEAGGCARFRHDLGPNNVVTGGTIEIYTRDHSGNDCLWVMPHATLDNLIAHELGHVLNLANSKCSNYIMGTNWPSATVNSDECGWVDEKWDMPDEQASGGGDGRDEEFGCPGDGCSPLVLDLNGDGIHTTSVYDPVQFDIDGNGVLDTIAWTDPDTSDGFLWVDLNANHVVDDGRELFGIGTRLPDGTTAEDGFVALRVYDDPRFGGDGDGSITSGDAIWGRLRIWLDENHNGLSEPTELGPIHRYGVVSIGLSYEAGPEFDANGNDHRLRGTFVRRQTGPGAVIYTTEPIEDIFFAITPY